MPYGRKHRIFDKKIGSCTMKMCQNTPPLYSGSFSDEPTLAIPTAEFATTQSLRFMSLLEAQEWVEISSFFFVK
jgi:hypothetical protein